MRNAPHPQTPKSTTVPENIDKVQDIVLTKKPLKVSELSEATGI